MWLSSGPRYALAKRQARRPFQPRLENLENRLAPATFAVLNTNNDGPDSFRQAILDANAAPGADVITFSIGGGGVQTIVPTSALPNVTGPVTIDGTTQPGFASSPIIELSGASAGAASGLVITAGSSTVRGLVINSFSGSGIALVTNGGNVVEGNHIGTNVAGTVALGNGVFGVFVGTAANRIGTNGDGVGDDAERNVITGNLSSGMQLQGADNNVIAGNYIGTDVSGTLALGNGGQGINFGLGASSNVIGTNGDGVGDAAESNVISGNGVTGVRIADSGSDQNIVAGNLIGTDKTGTLKLGNQGDGVFIGFEAQNNRIGTDGNGLADALERNVISGNRVHGIRIDNADVNVVAGNYIGTNSGGAAALGNGASGILIHNGAQSNRIGTDGNGVADTAERNLISGNGSFGVIIVNPGTENNLVAGNYVGTDVTGLAALGNGQSGIMIESAANNTIGGTTAAARNVVSANGIHGIVLFRPGAAGNVVIGNYVGTNAAGTAALGNTNCGVAIDLGAHDNRIGTDGDGTNDDAERNLLSGNRIHGVVLNGVGTNQNVVAGNCIGTDVTGSAALGNGANGISVFNGPQNNRIGTNGDGVSDAAERNLVSANGVDGVGFSGPGTSGNWVAGNYIGLDVTGTVALGNGLNGVVIIGAAHSNRIGTNADGASDAAERNVIAANAVFGVNIANLGSNLNVVAGNYVGTDVTGTVALGNGHSGIMMDNAANNTVGGTIPAARNVVAANGLHGIVVFRPGATGNVVIGNYVGTNAAGTAPLGNFSGGIALDGGAHHNLVGTDGDGTNDAAEGNLISGNQDGIILFQAGTDQNLVAGNLIGTDWTGAAALPNVLHGVLFLPGPQANQIGGSPALANTIAFNGDDGILLLGGTTLNNRLQANSIHSNGDMGIDLLNDDFTLNDTLDADAGPNGLQNFPVIISSTPGATTRIFGRFHSRPNTTYTLDFYANAVADPTGFGEGQRHLGAATVTTDANGDAHYFTVVVPGASVAGEVISATATDPDGNTSEFSGNRAPTASAGGPYVIAEGQGVTFDASASADPDFDALTYTWDVNGDGVFGDVVGVQPTLTWAQLEALGIDDGPHQYSVRVRVDDDAGHIVTSPGTTLTVTNVVPTASVAGPADGVRGQMRTFTLGAADPSAGDQAAGFVYEINWGDGSPLQTVTRTPGNGSGVGVDHVFAEAGTYTVTVNAADKDGGVSAAASMATGVSPVALQPDPSCDCGKTLLAVGGTPVNDYIVFNPGSGPGDVQVILNGVSLGTFSPTGRIIVYGQDGDDNIQVAGSISLPAWLYGDAGNDRLFGGGGPSVLLGGLGDDQLMGGSARDLMIGGLGADHLVGMSDDDILIGGTTAFDANEKALCAIVNEWTSGLDYATRVANLKGVGTGPRANGDYFLMAKGADRTVFDDGAADRLVGSSGRDWIFANLDGGVLDDVSGLLQTELVEDID